MYYRVGYQNGQLQSNTLPTQSEIQEIIGAEVDGVIGKESRDLWDAMIEQRDCNEWIMPIMEKFNEQFNRICLNGMKFDDN